MTKKRNIWIYPFILIGMLLMLTNSCEKDDNNNTTGQIPVLTTTAVSNITQTIASCGGNITSNGGATVTARGVCWSTVQNPTIAHNKTTDGTGAGSFTSNITGLTAGTIYYVRAYATNNTGTGYGSAMLFTTQGGTTVTDIDGNVYHTVTIGTQVWMVENLKTTKYRDGTSIPNVTDGAAWSSLTTGAYCDYANNPTNYAIYGKLYNWYAATNAHNIAPTGWHVPTDAEWSTLTTYLGGESVAGGKLKEIGTTHWASPNAEATNETGFTALPWGFRYSYGTFTIVGNHGYWWSSTEDNATYAFNRYMYYSSGYVGKNYNKKAGGLYVRCVRDL